MRSPVSFVASLVIAVAVSAGAQARPLLAVGVEAGDVVLVDPAKAQVVEGAFEVAPGRAASRSRGIGDASSSRWPGPPRTGSTRCPIGRPRDRSTCWCRARSRTRSPRRPRRSASTCRPTGAPRPCRTARRRNLGHRRRLRNGQEEDQGSARPLEVATRADGKGVYATSRAANGAVHDRSEDDDQHGTHRRRHASPGALVKFAPRGNIACAVNEEAGPTITIIHTNNIRRR